MTAKGEGCFTGAAGAAGAGGALVEAIDVSAELWGFNRREQGSVMQRSLCAWFDEL